MQGNYEKIVEKISKISRLEVDEIERKIEAKRAKLSGLISKEGAAQVIASELGINFDNEKLKINEILPGMRKVNTSGKVINLFPVRSYTNKAGKEGKVANFIIADDTSNTKVVLWDVNHISLVENGKIKEGMAVDIVNGSSRDNEVHLGGFSELKLSSEVFGDVVMEKSVVEKNICDFKIGDSVKVRAFVVQAFEPKFFEKKQGGDKGVLLNVVIDDGSESIRSVLFNENVKKIGVSEFEDKDKMQNQKEDLLGKEIVFSGKIRNNNFFNNLEFSVESVERVNMDELISQLEKK